jgi:hypothetical protein
MDVIWVSDAHTPAADFNGGRNVAPDLQTSETPWDQGWVDLLVAQGHNVDYQKLTPGDGYWRILDASKLDVLNAADLVIISRDTGSGSYADSGSAGGQEEETLWNSVTSPLILMNTYIARNSRWKWLDTTDLAADVSAPLMDLFDGDEVMTVDVLDGTVGTGNTSFILTSDPGNGEILAAVDGGYPDAANGGIDGLAGAIWVAQWLDTGAEFYNGAGESPADVRVLLTAGTREGDVPDGFYWGQGMYNLTPEGEMLFLDVINAIPEPTTVVLFGLGCLALRRRRR